MLPMALEVLHNTTVNVEWQVFYRYVIWVFPESYKEIEHGSYCNSSSRPNLFKPQTRPLPENPIKIAFGGTLAFQNALWLLPMYLMHMNIC